MKKRILQAIIVLSFPFLLCCISKTTKAEDISNKITEEKEIPPMSLNDIFPTHETIPVTLKIESITTKIPVIDLDGEDILEEEKLGDMELVAQLVMAEAGNQDFKGKCLVADVVYNRVDDPRFPNTVEEVIFQMHPTQFAVTVDGSFEKAGWTVDVDCFTASETEYEKEKRVDSGVLYFATTPVNGKNCFQHGDHWFGY